MKIRLNKELVAQCEAFHNGEISLADYRLQRRKVLEQLSAHSEEENTYISPIYKRIVAGAVLIVSLLVGTIILVKTLY